jgi:hypothetical protein
MYVETKKPLQIFNLQRFYFLNSDQDETRTHTGLLPLPPQSSVYTNFTTWPIILKIFRFEDFKLNLTHKSSAKIKFNF